MALRRTDHSSGGVLPTVARRVCDLENLVNEEAIAPVGLQRHVKKRRKILEYELLYYVFLYVWYFSSKLTKAAQTKICCVLFNYYLIEIFW
jgi:hypothetical protein